MWSGLSKAQVDHLIAFHKQANGDPVQGHHTEAEPEGEFDGECYTIEVDYNTMVRMRDEFYVTHEQSIDAAGTRWSVSYLPSADES